MALARYLTRRFLRHLLVVGIGVTLLFTSIEFFEKMMRVETASIGNVLQFLALFFFPTFFEYLPMSTWLAMLLLIREMAQQNEWESLRLLGIGPKKLTRYFTVAGVCLCLFSLAGKEIVTLPLARRAEQFRERVFKQRTPGMVLNTWVILSDRAFCYVGRLDVGTGEGHDFLMITLDKDFALEKTTSAPSFTYDRTTHLLTLSKARVFDSGPGQQEMFETLPLDLPHVGAHLSVEKQIVSLPKLLRTLIVYAPLFTLGVWRHMFGMVLKRLVWHLPVGVYPPLLLLLFLLGAPWGRRRWMVLLAVYPGYSVLVSMGEYLVRSGAPTLTFLAPGALLLGITGAAYHLATQRLKLETPR